jgi:hypothetical protein
VRQEEIPLEDMGREIGAWWPEPDHDRDKQAGESGIDNRPLAKQPGHQ